MKDIDKTDFFLEDVSLFFLLNSTPGGTIMEARSH